MSTADGPGERVHRVYAHIHEAPEERRWKRAVNWLQVCNLLVAACTTGFVIAIERGIETRNVEQKKIERSLDIIREFNKETEAKEKIDSFMYSTEVKLDQITNRFGYEENLVQSNLNNYILAEYNAKKLRNDLVKSLNERLDIIDMMKNCLAASQQLCDLDTLMISLQNDIPDMYVYLKPVFVCDEFYRYSSQKNAANGLFFMTQKFVDWSPNYYNNQEQILKPNKRDAYLLNVETNNISCANYTAVAASRKYRQ